MTLDMCIRAYSFQAMGTDCAAHLAGDPAVTSAAAALVIEEVRRIESTYSRYQRDSVLSLINQAGARGASVTVDAETTGLLDYAFALHRASDGLFDITSGVLRQAWDFDSGRLPAPGAIERLLPRVGLHRVEWDAPILRFGVAGMEIDFGGIGKEYAVDRAAEICRDAGITSGLIDLGGDIRVIGPLPNGAPWTVHVRHPRRPDCALATLSVANGAVASSGDYERFMEIDGVRYSHILDPTTGWPVRGLAAVTVSTDACIVAGSLATVAMLKASNGPAWLQTLGVPHVWMDEQGAVGGNRVPLSRPSLWRRERRVQQTRAIG